jgi:hypothetical protein
VGTKLDGHKNVKCEVFVVLDTKITVVLNMILCSFVERFSDLEERLLFPFSGQKRASCAQKTEAAGSSETLKNYIHIMSVSLWVCAAFRFSQHVKRKAVY